MADSLFGDSQMETLEIQAHRGEQEVGYIQHQWKIHSKAPVPYYRLYWGGNKIHTPGWVDNPLGKMAEMEVIWD